MNGGYYLRWKATVSGPFQAEEIKVMLVDGRINKHHHVSTDRITWTPIHEHGDFSAVCRVRSVQTAANASTVAVSSGTSPTSASGSATEERKLRLKSAVNEASDERWYYAENGQSVGPVTMWELRELVDTGTIAKSCPICKEGEDRWVKASVVFPSFWRSDAPRDASPENLGAAASVVSMAYAGFWLRLIAFVIDSILIGLISIIPAFILGLSLGVQMGATGFDIESISVMGQLLGTVVQFFVGWIYCAATESSSSQATPGKRALGIFVADLRGNRIGFGQASGRYFGKILSSMLLCIGYLMAGVTERKQALHDLMAGTLVLKRAS